MSEDLKRLERAAIEAVIAWRKSIDDPSALIAAVDALLAECGRCICSRDVRQYCASTICHGGADVLDQDTPDMEILWVERTWVDVRDGDTVRPPGQSAAAAVVLSASPVLAWHAAPGASQYRPNESPADWSAIRVVLESIDGRTRIEPPHGVKPDAAVEIEVTRAELRAIELLGGWGCRLGVTDL